MTADAEIVIGVRSDLGGARVIKRDLDSIADSGDRATKSTGKLQTSFEKMQARAVSAERRLKDLALAGQQNTERFKRLEAQTASYRRELHKAEDSVLSIRDSLNKTEGAATTVKNAFAAFIGALGIREMSRASDEMINLYSRLEQATRGAKELNTAFSGLMRSSQETGTQLSAAVDVFQRLSFSRDEIKASIEEMVVFTSTVQKLGVVSGASTTALQSGLLQLGQGLSAGILRAEEFNSILENIPVVGKAIADEFGVTTGQLRQLVLEGEVLSEDVFAAVLRQSQKVNEQFDKMPLTIGRAMTSTVSDLKLAWHGFNETTGSAQNLASVIKSMGTAAKVVGNILEGVFLSIQATGELIVSAITSAVNEVIEKINYAINLANLIPGVDIGNVSDFKSLEEGAKNAFQDTLKKIGDIDYVEDLGLNDVEIENTSTREISKNYKEIADNIKKASAQSKDFSKNQRVLEGVVKSTYTAQEKYNARVEELEGLRGFATSEEQIRAIERALVDARDELSEIEAKAQLNSPLGQAFKSLTSEIEDDFKDAFRSGFNDADGGFDKLINGWKSTFKTFLADLAYAAIARPIVMQVAGAVGGGLGLSNQAVAQGIGSVGGASGGGVGGLGDITSLGSSLLSGSLYSSTLGSVGAEIGASLFAGGDLLSSQAFIGSQALGNLGFGAFGSLGANLLGLGSDNGIVNAVSGTLGAVGGGAVGASMGTILGFAGGPVGAVVGSFLGTALGGLFGGKKPSNKGQHATLDLDTGEIHKSGQKGKKFSQKNRDFVDSVANEAKNISNLLKSVGAEMSGSLKLVVGSRDGLRIGGWNGTNYKYDSKAFINAAGKSVVDSITDQPDDLKTVLSKITDYSSENIAEAVGILELVRSFEEVKTIASPLTRALSALDDQFKELSDKVESLGLPLDKLTQSYQEQREEIARNALSPLQSFLDSQALSSNSTLSPIDQLSLSRSIFDNNLKAISLGDFSDLNLITSQAGQLLDLGKKVFASGEGYASLEAYVRQSIVGIADNLGVEGSINDNIVREITISNAEQTSLLQQMNTLISELTEENKRLRKEMERIGNSLVVQS